MQYVGNKRKVAERLAEILTRLRKPGQTYYELFMGSGAVGRLMENPRVFSDEHEDLILMTQEFIAGRTDWPVEMTEDEYQRWKKKKPSATRGWIGFNMGYRGRFFHTFRRHQTAEKFTASMKNLREAYAEYYKAFAGAEVTNQKVWDWHMMDALVYCDPPYIGTADYPGTAAFDHKRFWERMTELVVKNGNTVVVSEYVAPKDWPCVQRFWTTQSLSRKVRSENVFVHESQVEAFERACVG